jgi:hypothetical protein
MDRDNKRLYRIWSSMIQRCTNPKNTRYHIYKNVLICDKWLTYENFKHDLLNSYSRHVSKFGEKNTTLDRIDGNGGYFPTNVRWATIYEQRMNSSYLSMHEYNGVRLCMKDWSRIFGIPLTTLWDNIKKGKSLEEVIQAKTKFGQAMKSISEERLEEIIGQYFDHHNGKNEDLAKAIKRELDGGE